MTERELEKQLKALANHRRLSILKYLKRNHEAPVGDIAKSINLSFRSTSKHLTVLTTTNIVEKEQRSIQMFYRLVHVSHPAVRHILSLLWFLFYTYLFAVPYSPIRTNKRIKRFNTGKIKSRRLRWINTPENFYARRAKSRAGRFLELVLIQPCK